MSIRWSLLAIERYKAEIREFASGALGEIVKARQPGDVTTMGLMSGLRLLKTKKGDRMAGAERERRAELR